ncbi:MAG: thioesterase family protein [Anaerolineae bacterium]|nr:thioesterase family protein [Anaerolineae bacterium]
MPLTAQRTYRVRFHDCDVNQIVRGASWLRYMQEAAFAASDAVGYTEERYRAIHRIWLIRETVIEILHPLRYGDSVQITTWVDDFHRVRSRRAYEMRDSQSQMMVATAYTDWVLLDLETGWPAVIPDEMIAAFTPDQAPSKTLARRRFPAPPPIPASAHRQQQTVQWRDLDSAGHVNNAVYVDYIEDAARQDLAALGWPSGRLNDLGLDVATHRLHMEYRLPALLGDELIITTWAAEISEDAGMRYTTVTRALDDELLFQARATWGCIDLQTRARVKLPAALAEDLASMTHNEEKK